MMTRFTGTVAVALVALFGFAASASAQDPRGQGGRYTGFAPYEAAPRGLDIDRFGYSSGRDPLTCAPNSASEGNANQQNFPVKQYGQTSGGNRC